MPKSDTQFKPGQSGNPNGRPKGFSIVTHLKEMLQEVPEGRKATYATLITEKYLDKALVEGDVTILKDLINRVDGLPKGDMGLGEEGIVFTVNLNGNKLKVDKEP